MSFNLIFLIVITALNLFLGSIVLARNFRKIPNIYFFLMILSMSLWSISSFFEDEVASLFTARWLVRLDFASGIAMGFFFFLFSVSVIYELKIKSFLKYVIYIIVISLVSLSFTSGIINDISLDQGRVIYGPGEFFFLYGFVLFLVPVIGIVAILMKLFSSRGNTKRQLLYISCGLTISAFIALITNLILPRLFDVTPDITRLGIYGFLVFTTLTTYAIVRHRLMDIRLVVARSVAYIALIALLAIFYAGAVLALERLFFPQALADFNLAQGALRTGLAVIMVFTFQPLRKWITEKTDRLFYKSPYNSEELLSELSHKISSTIVMAELLHKTLAILLNHMKISRALYIIFKKDDRIYTNLSLGYKENFRISGEEIARLGRGGLIVYDELGEESQLKTLLSKYNASISIPLKTEKELAGVLLLGEKNSGEMFSNQDLRIFEIIAPEIAVAVENAKAYEEIQKFNVVLKDEISRATQDLKDANKNLRELDKAKDEFISMASHQLRTPLTAIKGYLSMLLEGDAGEVKAMQKEFMNEAYEGSNKMVALINNLLNVSRMETGRFFLEPVKFDLASVTKQEMNQLAKLAKEKKLKLVLEDQKVPQVFADEVKIRQVIMNFIDNAIHYTNQGTITIKIFHDERNVYFEVHDSGIGIPAEQQNKLFSKFFRADNAREQRPDGTGLGLYLAAKVVEEHKGKIIFSSEEGVGSIFGFKLPIEAKVKASDYNELSRQLLTKEPKMQELVGKK